MEDLSTFWSLHFLSWKTWRYDHICSSLASLKVLKIIFINWGYHERCHFPDFFLSVHFPSVYNEGNLPLIPFIPELSRIFIMKCSPRYSLSFLGLKTSPVHQLREDRIKSRTGRICRLSLPSRNYKSRKEWGRVQDRYCSCVFSSFSLSEYSDFAVHWPERLNQTLK